MRGGKEKEREKWNNCYHFYLLLPSLIPPSLFVFLAANCRKVIISSAGNG